MLALNVPAYKDKMMAELYVGKQSTLPEPIQKLGERLAANVFSSSLRMALSSSSEAGIFAPVVIVSFLSLIDLSLVL